jgi:hypothetical protein
MNTQRVRLRTVALPVLALLLVTAAGCQGIICLADPDDEHLCEPQGDIRDDFLRASDAVQYDEGVAWRVEASHSINLLETLHDTGKLSRVELPGRPTLLLPSPDKTRLVALAPKAQSLTIFTPSDPSQRTDYDLGSPFTTVDLSEDGRFAIAWFEPGSTSDLIVRNNNEMAIVDLGRDACAADDDSCTANPQLIPLRSLGSRPFRVEFAPPFTLRSQERRLALIMSEGYVTLLELDGFDPEAPNLNEKVVRFAPGATDAPPVPVKVVWTDDDAADDDDFFAFVLTRGSNDIIGLNLLAGEDPDALDRPRISPSLNQLTAGRGPVDIQVYRDRDQARKLLALNAGDRTLSVIDVATSDTVHVPLEEYGTKIQLYDAVNDDTDRVEQFALLYSDDSANRSLQFVELETVEVRRTRAIKTLHLDRGLTELRMTEAIGDIPRAVLLHAGGSSLSILNLERRFVTPLDVSSSISDYTFADEQTLLTVLSGQPYITFIDMQTGHPSLVELDMAAASVRVVAATNSVIVDHGDQLGAVTILRLDRPSRDESTTVFGIAAHDLFELEDPK